MAKFPGDNSGMMKCIIFNIPIKQDSITGKVFVEFVVGGTGELSNIKILRSPNELLSETIRLVENMPKWSLQKRITETSVHYIDCQ